MNCLLCLCIIAAGVAVCIASNFLQERAEITYFNPKYVRDSQAFTGRHRRRDPYRTNITSTILSPWGNNVTAEFYYKAQGVSTPFTLLVGICDVIKTKWLADYMRTYSNIKFICPLPPGTYSVTNMEFPPKNFPLPIPKGDIRVKITYFVTNTKEMILQVTLIVHA